MNPQADLIELVMADILTLSIGGGEIDFGEDEIDIPF